LFGLFVVLLFIESKEAFSVEASLTAKGQATIPKAIRKHLGLENGDRIKFFVHPDGTVVILPKLPVSSLRGMLKSTRKKPVSVEEMSQAAVEGAARHPRGRQRK
jgi:antitoxin PrlF